MPRSRASLARSMASTDRAEVSGSQWACRSITPDRSCAMAAAASRENEARTVFIRLFQPDHGGVSIPNRGGHGVPADRRAAGFLPQVHCPLERGRQRDSNGPRRARGIDHPEIRAARSPMKPGFHFRVAGLHLLLNARPLQKTSEKLARGRRVAVEVGPAGESAN